MATKSDASMDQRFEGSSSNLADLELMDSFQGNFYKSYKLIINFYRTKILGSF